MGHPTVRRTLRGMIAWRERKLLDNPSEDSRRENWEDELRALRVSLEFLDGSMPGEFIPQGLWSDHHAAIHTDCEWDWNGALELAAQRQADNEAQRLQDLQETKAKGTV